MSLKLVVGEDFPRAHWMLDDTSPYADYSGYEQYAVSNSTNRGTSLVKGASRSLIVSNSNKLNVTGPGFKQNKEYLPFSVEVYIRPVTQSGEQQIFGNDGYMDGIVMDGTVVSFVTKYTNTGEARASFDTVDLMNLGIVGIHTAMKNVLYINGEVVDEVNITPEQRADTYAAPGNNLSAGAGGGSFMMNSLALYDLELDDESCEQHYAQSQDTLGAEDVAQDYKGALLEFAPEMSLSPFYTVTYSSDEEWSLGFRRDVAVLDGVLYPVSSQGISQPGTWETVLPLGLIPTQIYAANLIWEGTGAKVFTSRDGELWEPAQKGRALTTIPRGTNGEGEFLYVRVAFDGGIAEDLSSFDNMVFSLYGTGATPSFSGREVILDKATPEGDYDVIDLHENWGLELEGGSVTIKGAVGDLAIKSSTIEVWVNKKGTITDTLSGADAVYSNGGAPKPLADGEWQLRHYVFNGGFTGDIVFSGTGQIGHIVLYPEALDPAVIKEIYDSYTGKPKIYVEVDEVFNVHEFNGQVDIYEYDWGIESAG